MPSWRFFSPFPENANRWPTTRECTPPFRAFEFSLVQIGRFGSMQGGGDCRQACVKKNSGENLIQDSDLVERLFNVSIDMLCVVSFDGYFVRLGAAWETTLGFTREELKACPLFEFVHPDDRERTVEQNRVVRSGGQARSFENRYRCKDGSYRWLMWNAAADLDARLIYSAARDITNQKKAQAEREELVQKLQAALAEVKTLQGILPICSYCHRVRDDTNYWHTVEAYLARHTNTQFSHGICPSCYPHVVGRQLAELGDLDE